MMSILCIYFYMLRGSCEFLKFQISRVIAQVSAKWTKVLCSFLHLTGEATI